MRIRVDRIACDGRGLCGEILPELITFDDWGFPIIKENLVPEDLDGVAHDAVELCPKLALRLEALEQECCSSKVVRTSVVATSWTPS